MIGKDVKGKIWEVQAMCQNDSTYRGTAERQDFYFKSPLAKLEENEDEYSRCWVYLSDNFKNKLRSFLEHLNDDQGFKLPQEDELTSYDNPEYLWLAYELEHIRHAYNSAMVNPYTGELLAGWLPCQAHFSYDRSDGSHWLQRRYPLLPSRLPSEIHSRS